jgi:hypothetical protein
MGLQDPSTLSVVILVAAEIKQVLDPKNIKAGECHFLTPHEMAASLGLNDAAQPEDHFGDVVISAFVGRRRKLLLPLNTPYTTKLKKLSNFIMSTRAVAALAALAILGWVGMTGWDIWTTKSDTENILTQEKTTKGQLEAARVKAKALPKQINTYTDIMTLTRIFNKRNYDPLAFVSDFASTLHDAAIVKALHWNLPDPVTSIKDADKRQVQVEMDLQLTTPKEPRGQFIASAQALVDRITKAFPDYEVTHSELPGLLSETKELKTVIDDNGSTPQVSEGANDSDVVKINMKRAVK